MQLYSKVIKIKKQCPKTAIELYLEDNIANTFTLLNTHNYTLTPNLNLNGTGRF